MSSEAGPAPPPRSVVSIAGDVLVFIAVLVLLYFAFLTTRPVLVAILFAAALSSLAGRLFDWLCRRMRGRRRLAALLSVFLLFAGVFAPIGFVGTVVVQGLVSEGTELAHSLQRTHVLSVDRLAPHLG